ncbi:crossover junction endonuclease MUS81 [Athalia rosae]|uniref:crossover junction endonuclease MUS81 n=1 Tax=Athalia rosae TaxID=37344 RepID=UPI002033AE18|nr:crossover junction endonuclease MUS81 [Athalia rosae]XP_048514232.1 crossover junction endonuclease MUS81 [Athalia rosae]XP_048514233.1 crossover junction endonuclease MUS81 [Athalia rosae]XP_048514234.1 crossover junction endonuclease MUS81 [Athalia rosae]
MPLRRFVQFILKLKRNQRDAMKRVKVKRNCPNPLFIQWLEEWKDDAASKGSEMQHCFGKALTSLKQCPLTIPSGRDCKILRNFGPKLCAMLDKKLEEYKAQGNAIPVRSAIDYGQEDQPKRRIKKSVPDEQMKNNENTKHNKENPGEAEQRAPRNHPAHRPYMPAWRSGGYAILLTLYEKSKDPGYIGYMGKDDLQSGAKHLCDHSMTKATPGTRYNAWSSMSTLIEKGLVLKSNNPARYRLTDAGLAMAIQLADNPEDPTALIGCSSNSSKEQLVEKKNSNEENITRNSRSPNQTRDEVLLLSSGSNSPNGFTKDWQTALPNQINVENIQTNFSPNYKDKPGFPDTRVPQSRDQESSGSSYDNVIFAPNTFDIVLLVDNGEIAGGNTLAKDDATIAELTKTKTKFEVRDLKVGDFTWIARSRDSGVELILPYIMERKRMDDFAASIKDGRYQEQKCRLKKCGIPNKCYLVESYGNNNLHLGLAVTSIFQAATNTLVQDGFDVKYTNSHRDTMLHLAGMTFLLTKIYQEKTLIACKKEDLIDSDVTSSLTQLMVFDEFNKAAAKVKKFKVKEMFIQQLMQLSGISMEKAFAIVNVYPTPKTLINSFKASGTAGENLLSHVEFGTTNRRLGSAISKTLYQFYTRKDL